MESGTQQKIIKHPPTLETAKRKFLTYVNTSQFQKLRLKGIDESESVHISQSEIEERVFIYPYHDRKKALAELVNDGELIITEGLNPLTGRKYFLYDAPLCNKVDFYLIKPKIVHYDSLTRSMQANMKRVTLPPDAPSTVYFNAFLKFNHDLPDLFFTLDDFSGRVHTPVSNFKRLYRPNLLIDGRSTIGLDVTTMQPLLLGKILKQKIGDNQYSRWIESGRDIYVMLQEIAKLETRDEGKDRFFEILFAPPNNELAAMFGGGNWISWINQYKKAIEPGNPHNKAKPYSNLAWLLQSTEVQIMRQVWQALTSAGIPFLSVHDEIIIKEADRHQAEGFFRVVLDREFTFYKLNIKSGTTTPAPEPTLPQKVAEAPTPPPGAWDQDIKDLESFFAGVQLPVEPLNLSQYGTITDIRMFLDGHLETVKANNGKRAYLPYLERLKMLMHLLN